MLIVNVLALLFPALRTLVTVLQKNEKGETPLHVACISGNLRKVTALLDDVRFTLCIYIYMY